MKNNNYCKRLLAGILAVVLILSVTACDTRQKIYNNYTMHTVTSFGFTDDGKARVSVDYTGYRDTKGADIDVTIEKQGFLFFWEKVVTEHYNIEEESYQHEYFYDIDDDGTYRCTVVYTVFGSGENDVITFKDTKDYRANDMISETTDTSTVQTTTAETSTTETTIAETTTETTTEEMTTTVQTEPPESEEEKERRLRYEAAVEALNAYLESFPRDVKMLEHLYNEFEALGDYEDSEMYFSHFTALPDMLSSIVLTKIYANGKITETEVSKYHYDEDGCINYISGEDLHVLSEFVKPDETESNVYYSPNGTIQIHPSSPVQDNKTVIFGENGKLMHISTNTILSNPYALINPRGSQLYTFSYNENGDLTRKQIETTITGTPPEHSANYTNKYITTETWNYQHIYDENGVLKQTTITHNRSYDQTYYVRKSVSPFNYYTYTYTLETKNWSDPTKKTIRNYTADENGRIISAEIIDDSKQNITEYQTYHYETLYFYTEE